MENIIQISHLNKRFGDVQAVKDLSYQVRETLLNISRS